VYTKIDFLDSGGRASVQNVSILGWKRQFEKMLWLGEIRSSQQLSPVFEGTLSIQEGADKLWANVRIYDNQPDLCDHSGGGRPLNCGDSGT
jgi:hypothetical protein